MHWFVNYLELDAFAGHLFVLTSRRKDRLKIDSGYGQVDYLREETRVLHEQLGGRRLRFTDDQRCRLAVKAKGLSRGALAQLATIVTPETLLAWLRS